MAWLDKTAKSNATLLLSIFLILHCNLTGCDAQGVEKVTDSNWTLILENEWLVKFYAPWCPACRNLEPTWKSLGDWAANKAIRIGDVDVTEQSALSGRFMITALPTVYHIKNGEFRTYAGPRALDDFIKYVDDEEWKNTSPVPSWKGPESYMMSFVSNLFQFSVKLKDLHTLLTDVYGLPVWASFIFFGIIIILLGLLLGMVLVLATDYFFGPPETSYEKADNEDDDDDENDENDEEDGEKTSKTEDESSSSEDEENKKDEKANHVDEVKPKEDKSVRKRNVAKD